MSILNLLILVAIVPNCLSQQPVQPHYSESNLPSGYCFKEVPTASLVKDASNIPAGNGSRRGFSKIQVCCNGYQRNSHNSSKCDPRVVTRTSKQPRLVRQLRSAATRQSFEEALETMRNDLIRNICGKPSFASRLKGMKCPTNRP